jgi:preprotein translocase subunit SecB
MNDIKSESGGNGSSTDTHQFTLQRLYVKDLSFETPNSPSIFSEQQGDPDIKLNLRHTNSEIDDKIYEVVLHVSIHATLDGKTVFLMEMDQAGLFQIDGYAPDDLKKLLGTYCSTTLFPYARETISSTIGKGGFPPLILQPINFDAIYAQSTAEVAET